MIDDSSSLASSHLVGEGKKMKSVSRPSPEARTPHLQSMQAKLHLEDMPTEGDLMYSGRNWEDVYVTVGKGI